MVKINRNVCYLFFVNIKNKLGYFGDMTSLHGIPYVFSMSRIPYLKRLFWTTVVMCCCFGAGWVLHSALKLFSTGLASYSVDTNYLKWDTPFPAVTVCDDSEPEKRTEEYLKQHKKSKELKRFYAEMTYLTTLYCSFCNLCNSTTSNCEEDFHHGVEVIRYKCPDLMTDCWWSGKHFRCCDMFHPIETEFGQCYVFNSALLGNTSILTVNRKIGLPDLLLTTINVVKAVLSGADGRTIKTVVGGGDSIVIVHTPDDIVSVPFGSIFGPDFKLFLNKNLEAILKAEQTVNDASVAYLPVSMRGCLFKKERPSLSGWPFQQYSYSACQLYCRQLSQIAACKCTHHFLSKIFGTPACDIKGLACLNMNQGYILDYQCDCPAACDDTQYKIVHLFSSDQEESQKMENQSSRMRIRLAYLPSWRVRRLAIKDTLGLVVDVGGVGGVFFGASLLSVIELLYLLCMRRH